MKIVDWIQNLLIHLCMICALVIGVVQILDWYNPFMNFAGHSKSILYIWCAGSLLHGVLHIVTRKKI